MLALCSSIPPSNAAPDPAVAGCTPPNHGAAVFPERGYKGACKLLQPGSEIVGAKAESIRFDSFGRGVFCVRWSGSIRCRSGSDPDFGAFVDGPVYIRVEDRFSGSTRCDPRPEEATLSVDFMGEGPCLRLKPGTFDTARAIGLADDFDSATAKPAAGSSAAGSAAAGASRWMRADDSLRVKVGSNLQARLCRNERITGDCEDLTAGGFREVRSLRSARLTLDCRPAPGKVAVFAQSDWRGACRILGPAMHEGGALKFADAGFASLRVGSQTRALRCAGLGSTGSCEALLQSERNTPAGTQSLAVQILEPAPAASAPNQVQP